MGVKELALINILTWSRIILLSIVAAICQRDLKLHLLGGGGRLALAWLVATNRNASPQYSADLDMHKVFNQSLAYN